MRRATALLEPLPITLLALAAGLTWPSPALATWDDLILAALVLAVALTIDPSVLRASVRAWPRIAAATALPLFTLLPVSMGLGLLFQGPEREGLLALGLSSAEVAAAGLAALAGGSASVTLAVVVLSLFLTAAAAPLLAPLIARSTIGASFLLVRFTLVVAIPLAAGLGLRAGGRLPGIERGAERASVVVLGVLVYAVVGGLRSPRELGGAVLAAALFLGASVLLALLLHRLLGDLRSGGFAYALRDFAVAAVLAGQLGSPGAEATTAVYGPLMLIAASGGATILRSRRQKG